MISLSWGSSMAHVTKNHVVLSQSCFYDQYKMLRSFFADLRSPHKVLLRKKIHEWDVKLKTSINLFTTLSSHQIRCVSSKLKPKHSSVAIVGVNVVCISQLWFRSSDYPYSNWYSTIKYPILIRKLFSNHVDVSTLVSLWKFNYVFCSTLRICSRVFKWRTFLIELFLNNLFKFFFK